LYKNARPTPAASLYRTLQYTPVFTPTAQLGCWVWLDGADTTTMTFSGSNITAWNDKSGSNRNMAAQGSTYGTYSLADYSVNTVSPAYMSSSATANMLNNAAYTIFVVERASDVGVLFGDATFVDTTTNASLHAVYTSSTTLRWGYYNNDLDITVPALGSTRMWTFVQPSVENRYIRLNGSLVATHTNATKLVRFGILAVGTWWGATVAGFNGKIYEFVLYAAGLSTVQLSRVEGYLAWKWKIQHLLPSTHPFRNSPS